MRTGKLNRIWSRGKEFFENKHSTFKSVIAVICVIITIITVIAVGGFKVYADYDESQYIALEKLVKEAIVADPYMDLQLLEDPNVDYTCNYDSKKNTWILKISKDTAVVNANVSYLEDGTYDVKTSYDSKAWYYTYETIAIVCCVILVAYLLYIAIWIAIYVLIAFLWLVCLGEKAVILIKNKKNN